MISIPAHLPDCVSDHTQSPIFDIPAGFTPFVFQKRQFLIRIWRLPAEDLNPWELRRPVAFLEFTDLDEIDPSPCGLHWSYSQWKNCYILHGHIQGSTKHWSLQDLYKRCTREIAYFVKKIGREHEG